MRLGRWRNKPVGPHPVPMFQVAFEPALFAAFVPWLMLNRQRPLRARPSRTPATTSPNHRDYPLWLGERLALDFSVLD